MILTEAQVEANRAVRVARERAAGIYQETIGDWFQRVIEVRSKGQSMKRVEHNPHLPKATPAMLRGLGRNVPCPCGSGRKTKWCCL